MKHLNAIYSTYLLLGSILVLSGCNQDGAGCFDKAGKNHTVSVDVPAFITIDVSSNIDIQLLGQGADLVELTTGENLIAGISFEVQDGILKIDNHNKCFWSNGYTHPLVKIRNADLEKIIQHGYGKVFSTDTLTTNKLTLQVEDASGGIDLRLQAGTIQVVSNNMGSITLTGTADRLNAGHYWSDGILYARDLQVTDCYINHHGSNRMEINVLNNLSGKISSLGNVYLFNQRPATESVEISGEGEIIEAF